MGLEDLDGHIFHVCRNLKIPSKWPSVVCENCLYSLEKDMRTRAFHIMDPKGILEMLVIFIEEQGNEMPAFSTWNSEISVCRLLFAKKITITSCDNYNAYITKHLCCMFSS